MPRRGEPRTNNHSAIEARLAQDNETAYLKRKRERDLKRKFYESQYPAISTLHKNFDKHEGNETNP